METISFARGVPAPELIPAEELADCARAALGADGGAALAYGPPGGYPPLRAWIAERHGVDPAQVLLTNGSLQGFVFLVQLLVRTGARVLVEAPTYDRPLRILSSAGADIVGLPLDDDGLDVAQLDHALRSGPPPAFLYTISTFQNPSGRTLALERRTRLVELAREHDLRVLEDDPYGLVRFEGEPLPTLHELAAGKGVVYASSFSKTVAPGLRVGYFVLPRELVGGVEAIAVSTTISPGVAAEAIVWEFLRRGNFEPNLARLRELLRARRDAMVAALERELPEGATWSRPDGGYFVWLELPHGTSSAELLERASDAGAAFVKGSDFFPEGRGGASAARLAYSFVTPAEIDEGIARLGSLLPAAAPL